MASQPPPQAKSLAVFSDGISALSYLPASDRPSHLVATSWDGTVQIHDTTTAVAVGTSSSASALLTQSMESGPLLSLATPASGQTVVATGGMDGSVKLLDYTTSEITMLGRHTSNPSEAGTSANACSCLAALDQDNRNILASASWNRQLCLWDCRVSSSTSTSTSRGPVATLDLPGKAFSMDVDASNHRLVVATSGRRNVVVDVRNFDTASAVLQPQVVLDRESSLKFQTRSIRFFPDGRGFALGSVEGRVGVEVLEDLPGLPPHSMKRYAFKCHRVNDTVYPVNAIAFHPRYTTTFATGGCDGSVVLWDGGNKKKLTTLPTFATSISALAFNHDGSELAIASSYTFEDGDREHPQDELFVRKILDSECLPKESKS